MKKLALTFLLICFAPALQPSAIAQEPQFPKYVGYVNDFANVISPGMKRDISKVIEVVERSTTAEIAVVTIDTIAPLDIDFYAVKLFERWGIGKKGKDNGILIILAMKERKWRIEAGYGLEGALPDAVCSEIGRKMMVPYFQRQQFDKGLLAGTMAVSDRIAKEYNVDLGKLLKEGGYQGIDPRQAPTRSVFSTIFTLLLLILLFGMRMGLFGFLLLGRPGYWGGGYAGSGGFGGGFGGFGGGMSGGGGASGGW